MCGHWQHWRSQESGQPHGPDRILASQGPKARGQSGGMGDSLRTGSMGWILGPGRSMWKCGGFSFLSHAPLQLGAASPKMLPEIEKGWQEGSGSGKGGEREITVEGEQDWVLWMGRAGTLQKH